MIIDSYNRDLHVSQGGSLPLLPAPSAFQVASPLPSPPPSPFPEPSLAAAGEARDTPIVLDEIDVPSVEWVKYDTALKSTEPGRQFSDDIGDRGIQLLLEDPAYVKAVPRITVWAPYVFMSIKKGADHIDMEHNERLDATVSGHPDASSRPLDFGRSGSRE